MTDTLPGRRHGHGVVSFPQVPQDRGYQLMATWRGQAVRRRRAGSTVPDPPEEPDRRHRRSRLFPPPPHGSSSGSRTGMRATPSSARSFLRTSRTLARPTLARSRSAALSDPIFFDDSDWAHGVPAWSPSIVQGKSDDDEVPSGAWLWDQVRLRLQRHRFYERMED